MPNYGHPKYWDERYGQNKGAMFDWLEDYETLSQLLNENLTKDSKILIIGCGNAIFSEDLFDAGFKHIWNIDISSVVIE